MKNLIIIPARSGSKGIPQKNIRFLNGKPLIYYAIQNALSVPDADVYVSTDSQDIAHIASIFGCKSLQRDFYADDMATIDDVAYYETERLLRLNGKHYDTIITLQPTSPLLKKQTLLDALQFFEKEGIESLVSASEKRHLSWRLENNHFTKMYKERVNRQKLEPIFEENGAFVLCKSKHLLYYKTRIAEDLKIFPISEQESIDIDTQDDWILAENILKRKRIAFVTNGSFSIGMGHIHRCLNLSNKFVNDDILFFSQKEHQLGIKKLQTLNYHVNIFDDFRDLVSQLIHLKVDVVINDILDTQGDYIKAMKEQGMFIVNFEDTGDGTRYADIVINALYEWSSVNSESYYGYKYEVLREDIFLYDIKKSTNEKIQDITISFGGTDIENATLKVLQYLCELNLQVNITLILGVGYKYLDELDSFLKQIDCSQIKVVHDVKFMADYIYSSDLVISGNGRMVYEIVSLGVPSIIISQNEREMSHLFPTVCKGIKYLGYINTMSAEKLKESVLMMNTEVRMMMQEELYHYAKEIREGSNKVVSIINEKYSEFKNEIQ